jgi:hypothetical protein
LWNFKLVLAKLDRRTRAFFVVLASTFFLGHHYSLRLNEGALVVKEVMNSYKAYPTRIYGD